MSSKHTVKSYADGDNGPFEEIRDPLIVALQDAIGVLQARGDKREFRKVLDKIYLKFPLVDLVEFVDLYVEGEYAKEMIRKFNLAGYADHKDILQILRMRQKRKSIQKGPVAKKINLTDPKMAERYNSIKEKLKPHIPYMREKITHNALRMILTLLLYKNEDSFSSVKDLANTVPETIEQFGHVIPAHCKDLLGVDPTDRTSMAKSILQDMRYESLLDVDASGRVRLERHQLRLQQYMLNAIHKQSGITHEGLAVKIRKNLPVMQHMPQAILLIMLDGLIRDYKILKKEGYWKLRPYFDEYFPFDDYVDVPKHQAVKKSRFFGRRIRPDDFIKEVLALEKGDFEDQDDQVTRIAGMVLSRANMMKHPPNELDEFDFAVDLSQYEFAKSEQEIMQSMGLVIRSNHVYVKVMISDKVTPEVLGYLSDLLSNRGRGEQGLVISFSRISKDAKSILERDRTIQLITKDGLMKWCNITPVIPTRRGAVAVVRRGDYKGHIVKVASVNYESGLADIIMFPNMYAGTQYIGSLEEITLHPKTELFVDHSNKYFTFLGKLRAISKTTKFREIVADGISVLTEGKTSIIDMNNGIIRGNFGKSVRVLVDLADEPDAHSLEYSTEKLFSCTCTKWRDQNRADGLCPHIIFTLNEAVKRILSSDNSISGRKIGIMLSQMEVKMDVFLDRLKYSTNDSGVVRCPNCGMEARTLDEVKSSFGYRQMDPNKKFSLRRQSRCRWCR